MRILHIVPQMNPSTGGVCQAVRTIIAGLAELEVQNEVVSLDAADAPFLADDNFPVHALGVGKGPWAYNAELLPWLVANMPRFEAVVVHGLWLYYSYAARQALRRVRAAGTAPRLYIMPHGMLDPYFQRAPGRRLKAIRNTLYWMLLEQQLIAEADAILFTCEEERLLAQQPFQPYRPKRTIVVGLGVEEPPAYQPAMQQALLALCPELRGQPYMLFLSRIHEKKGVDLLLEAYASVAAAGPLAEPRQAAALTRSVGADTSVAAPQLPKLVVAGPGLDTAYGQRMQELVANSAVLQKAVLFPGMLTGDAKWGAFYGCECSVLPSHQENFGIAVVEALACGKPVLISNQVNIWREIEGAGGGIVAPDTLPGVQKLLGHWQQAAAAEKARLQKRARVTFEQEFAVGPAAQRFLQAVQP
ncbi:glycosyltransferase [Hymenobacter bucti]|uniref:Glycosyltransferase n=1 Tax=Hymenobacter bucti TaxID=1844114 RepID=A0ABW4QNV3_9BACT